MQQERNGTWDCCKYSINKDDGLKKERVKDVPLVGRTPSFYAGSRVTERPVAVFSVTAILLVSSVN